MNVFIAALIFFYIPTAAARAPRSCRIFAETAIACLELDDQGYEGVLKSYCQSLYADTREVMAPGPLRRILRETIRGVTCDEIRATGPFEALERAVIRFRVEKALDAQFDAQATPARKRSHLITQRMRREWISYPQLPDCPSYDQDRMPETGLCCYHSPSNESPERPDLVLVMSGGMVTGMNLLRHVAEMVIDALAPRFDVWAYVAESTPLHTEDIRALRWQIANLARGFVAEHLEARVVVLGFSNGAAQVFHALNEVFPRSVYAGARPALAILLDIVDATPFVDRTLTLAPGVPVLAFRGRYASPSPPTHGAHRLRCVDPSACAVHAVLHPDGRLAHHAEIPGLVTNSPEHRKSIIKALEDALPGLQTERKRKQ